MINFNGYNENSLTFYNDGAKKGDLVCFSESQKVKKCTDNNDFVGVCIASNDEYAVVRLDGYTYTSFSSTPPSVNYCGLVSDANGGVKVSSSAKKNYKVLKVDKVNHKVGFIL